MGVGYNIQSMDDTRDVTQDGQQDVDEEISTASALQEDTDGRQEDGKNDLADIAGGESHVGGWLVGMKIDRFGWIECWERGLGLDGMRE